LQLPKTILLVEDEEEVRSLTRCREVAKRLECVQLAGAFEWPGAYESGSKLHALQTLRATSSCPMVLPAANWPKTFAPNARV